MNAKLKRGLLLLLVISLACFMLLAGCSGDGEEAQGESLELVIASGADPVNMDPRKTWVGPGYSINAHILEPLVFREYEEDGKVNLIGVLAESWEQRDDLTWVFHLREGVTFHNGEPLTAEAVKYTYESIMDPDFVTPLKTWLTEVESIEAEDDLTVVIKTKNPTRGLLSSLAQLSIVEPTAVEEMGEDYNLTPVGTGPYKVYEYVPNNQVVVEKYEDYWGTPGKADKITFRILPENATRIAALERGEVMLAEAIPPDKLETIRSKDDLDVVYTPTLRVDFIEIQHDRPWMDNLKFRQAMSYAIDREAIVENILNGSTIVANSPSPPGTTGYNEDLPPLEYDLEKAKALLEECGYDGSPIKFGAPIGRYAMDKQIGEAIAGMLTDAGINIEFEALDWSSYYPKTTQEAYDMYYIGMTDFTINPFTHYSTVYHSETNDTYYNNPEVDAMLNEAIQTMDDDAAAAIYSELQEMLIDDMATIPLHYEPQLIGINEKLENFEARSDEYVILRDVELAE